MVENDEHLFRDLDRILKLIDRYLDFVRKLLPSLIDIINFVNVESARVRPELKPDVLVDRDASPFLKEFHCISESV